MRQAQWVRRKVLISNGAPLSIGASYLSAVTSKDEARTLDA
jgi:hypothetical protein